MEKHQIFLYIVSMPAPCLVIKHIVRGISLLREICLRYAADERTRLQSINFENCMHSKKFFNKIRGFMQKIYLYTKWIFSYFLIFILVIMTCTAICIFCMRTFSSSINSIPLVGMISVVIATSFIAAFLYVF